MQAFTMQCSRCDGSGGLPHWLLALQMVVFKRNRKCVPLPNSTCAALLAPGTKYDFQLPQSLDKSATDRLLNAFNARAKEVGQAVEEDAPALVSPSPSTPAPEAAEAGAEAEVFAGMSAGELHEAYKAQQAQEQLFEQAKHDAEFAAKLQVSWFSTVRCIHQAKAMRAVLYCTMHHTRALQPAGSLIW